MTRPRKVFWHLGEEIWTFADYPEKADLGNKPFDENRRYSDRLLPRLSRNRSSEITSYFGRRNLGTVLGCYLCIVNLAGFLSHATIAFFLAAFDNWTILFLLLGSLRLAGALAYLLMREPRTVPVATPGHRAGEPTF